MPSPLSSKSSDRKCLVNIRDIVVNRGGWGRGIPKSTHDARETDHVDQN